MPNIILLILAEEVKEKIEETKTVEILDARQKMVYEEEKYTENIPSDEDYDSESDSGIDDSTREVIKIINVHKTYLLGIEGVPALRGINVTINEGEFITVLGTSGGGKTTLLNIIGTIDKPSKGDVYICGLRIKHSTKDTLLA